MQLKWQFWYSALWIKVVTTTTYQELFLNWFCYQLKFPKVILLFHSGMIELIERISILMIAMMKASLFYIFSKQHKKEFLYLFKAISYGIFELQDFQDP